MIRRIIYDILLLSFILLTDPSLLITSQFELDDQIDSNSHGQAPFDPLVSYDGGAYIITTKTTLDPIIKSTARMCGYEPIMIPAVQPYGHLFDNNRIILAKCLAPSVINDSIEVEATTNFFTRIALSLVEMALICTHRKVWRRIANDEGISEHSWSLILEDDARVHPKLNHSIHAILDQSIQYLTNHQSYGFLYLGICNGLCEEGPTSEILDLLSDCYGTCSHAYAITKHRARTLFNEIYNIHTGSLFQPVRSKLFQIDQGLYKHFRNGKFINKRLYPNQPYPNAYTLGMGRVSPVDPGHSGVLYQERSSSYSSKLRNSNEFKPFHCVRMMISHHEIRQHYLGMQDIIGYLFSKYSVLIAVCQYHDMAVEYCGELQFMDDHEKMEMMMMNNPSHDPNTIPHDPHLLERESTSYDSMLQVAQSLQLMHRSCPIQSSDIIYQESIPTQNQSIDSNVFHQPSGTSYRVSFQSPQYFHPSAYHAIKDQIQISFLIRKQALQFLNQSHLTIHPLTREPSVLVCASVYHYPHLQEGVSSHPYLSYVISAFEYYRKNIKKLIFYY